MKLIKIISGIILVTAVFQACKVSKSATTSRTPNDSLPSDSLGRPSPSEPLVSEVPDTVNLNIYRVFPDTISIIGVGDMMIGTNYPTEKYLPPDSGKYIFSYVKETLSSADLTFGNLEGVILNEGGIPKKCKNPEKCYIFRMPEYMADHFVTAGFDVLSVANNHSNDFGDEGRENTGRVLESRSIYYAGFDTKPYTIIRKGEIIYGFAAFAPNKGTASINDLEEAINIVQHLDSISDIVIVSFHGGAEGKDFQHVTRETELFYGENRGNVYEFSHKLIDAGADVLFGHGPHVPRAIEVYEKRFVAYSLGNFSTYARFNLRNENGLAPIIKIYTNAKGEFYHGKIISAIQTGLGIPKIDSKNRASLKIMELFKNDFPEGVISVDPSGVISYIEK